MTIQPAPQAVQAWQRALSFAAHAHRHQFRKDNQTPYFSHPARVCMTVAVVFACDDAVALTAAALHDTIEDTTTDYDDLDKHFGAEVASVVACLTKNMALPDAEREAEYDARLRRGDWRARLIKLADVYDNLCDTGTFPEAKREQQRHKAVARARRAIALAAGDMAHPSSARAIEAVRALLGE